jgi:hypothetical protein
MSLKELQKKNEMNIYDIHSDEFKEFGRVIDQYDLKSVKDYIEVKTSVPEEGNIYVGSDVELENVDVFEQVQSNFYGSMDLQAGYCNGNNSRLTGLEYHKASEVNLAVTPLVLLLGKVQDINNNSYDSKNVKAFYLEEGDVVEIYGTTLHFAPCKVSEEGFKCLVVLPKGTNEELTNDVNVITEEDELLFKTNKWLLVHEDSERLINNGAKIGITGSNLEIKF